jgi:hypothetical protein
MRVFRTLAVLLLLAPAFVAAQSRPDFSGSWVLDSARSQLPPTNTALAIALTYPRTVTQTELEIRMVTTTPAGAPSASPQLFRFTSTPNVSTSEIEGRVMRSQSAVQWENDTVVRTMSATIDGQPAATSRDVLRLEEDGRVMTYTREMRRPEGQTRVLARYVYVRGS